MNREATSDWFVTFMSSMLQNSFVVSPLRLLGTAAFNLYYKKGKFLLSDWIGIPGNWGRQKAIADWRYLQAQHGFDWFHLERMSLDSEKDNEALNKRREEMERLPWCYKPPNFRSLLKAGKFKIAVTQVRHFWKETLTWVFLTSLLSSILFIHKDSRLFRLNQMYKNHYVQTFEDIQNIEEVFDYMEQAFLPAAFKDTLDTANTSTILLGAIRMKQARLKFIACRSTKSYSSVLQRKRCMPEEMNVKRFSQFDVGWYGPFWMPLTHQDAFNSEISKKLEVLSPWIYSNLSQTYSSGQSNGNNLRRSYYPHGGFVVDLRGGKETMLAALNGLKATSWIDRSTSAIFVNAAFYSKHSQHVTSIFLAVETLSQGSLNKYYEINSFKLPYFYSTFDVMLVIFQIFHFLMIIYLIYDLIRQCREIKWQRRGVFQILFSMWNVLAFGNAILSFVAYMIYISFIINSLAVIRSHKEDTARYIAFDFPAYLENLYVLVLSFANFLSFVRMLKVFRCSSTVTVMIDAFGCCRTEILNVSVLVIFALVAFGSFWYAAFGYTSFAFGTLTSAFYSAYSLLIGLGLDTSDAKESGDFSGNDLLIKEPMFGITFCIFVFLTVAILINIYVTTVENGYKKMKVHLEERSWDPVETLAVVWLIDKMLNAIGITKYNLNFLKVRGFILVILI